MKRCPITYEPISSEQKYSKRGLRLLSSQLQALAPLTLTAQEQRQTAIANVGKMSIQGVQPKLSAVLKITAGRFDIVAQSGQYILKLPHEDYPQLPENEAVTMSLAKMIGLDVPLHGLLYAKDNSMTYFIKRFDRIGRSGKCSVEDFSQLSGQNRETKYNSSMEKVAKIVEKFCSFPQIEFFKLFKLTLFNYLIGNEDMHLKNYSLINIDSKITFSPVYDLLNTTIAQKNTKEEIALPLHGKKNNLQKKDFIEYFALNQLQLNENIVDNIMRDFQNILPDWQERIQHSFLSSTMQEKYLELLTTRSALLGLCSSL